MTFLELCQRVAQEAGLNDNRAAGSMLPTTVGNQEGVLKRIVDDVAEVWRIVQGDKHWDWMWEQASLSMLANTNVLAGTIPETRYEKETLHVTGRGFCEYVPWQDFRLAYPDVQAGDGFSVWTVAPDGSIRTNVKPAANTPFTVERYHLPTELTIDGDVPEMPADLHMLLVWMAIVHSADFDEAGTQRATAIQKIRKLKANLFKRCLPSWSFGGPMGDDD
jgi:hypothetical protein